MVRRGLRALGWALALTALTGCREVPATQLLVVVDSDLVVDSELNQVEVIVSDPSGQTILSERGFALLPQPRPAAYTLPLSFGLVPIEGDASRRVRVTVRGRTVGAGRTVDLTAVAGFLPNRKLLLTMFLQRACVGMNTCGPGQTCVDGGCASDQREVLPDITAQAIVDASSFFEEARTDATADEGTPDAGATDAGTPDAGTPDLGTLDAGTPDAGTPDAGTPDAGATDVGTADSGGLPTPRLTFPTAGAISNSRQLWFEFRAAGVPSGVAAAVEVSNQSDFAAAATASFNAPAATVTGGVSRWDVSPVDADSLRGTGGPLGSSGTLWWRARLSLGATIVRSVAWPFRLRTSQPARTANTPVLQRLRAVGQAGDFNGDGFSDVFIVTAHSGISNGGNVMLGRRFLRTEGTAVNVSDRAVDFGRAARLGDLDGDGLEEFGVASGFPGGTGDSGAVYLVAGSTETTPRPLELVPSLRGDPTSTPALLAPVMDADRDGIGEFAVGLPATGTVRVYRGLAAARAGTFLTFPPAAAGEEAEMSLSTAGDVNGDGRGDFIVGYPSRRVAALYVAIDATSGGFAPTTLEHTGLTADDAFGVAVAGGGDLNGDGFSDVVVAGTAGLRVFYGGLTGIAATSTFVDPTPCGRATDATPRRLAILGDLNGDGGDEVGLAYVGECMVVLRAPVAPAASGPVLVEARTLFPLSAEPGYAAALAPAGDCDGDGLADFSLGIPDFGDVGRSTTKVYFGDPAAWAEGMSLDGGVSPSVIVLTPGPTGWGYSLAARALRRWPAS